MTATLPPRDQRWFEDYVPGDVHEFGDRVVDEQELVLVPRGTLEPNTYYEIRVDETVSSTFEEELGATLRSTFITGER